MPQNNHLSFFGRPSIYLHFSPPSQHCSSLSLQVHPPIFSPSTLSALDIIYSSILLIFIKDCLSPTIFLGNLEICPPRYLSFMPPLYCIHQHLHLFYFLSTASTFPHLHLLYPEIWSSTYLVWFYFLNAVPLVAVLTYLYTSLVIALSLTLPPHILLVKLALWSLLIISCQDI